MASPPEVAAAAATAQARGQPGARTLRTDTPAQAPGPRPGLAPDRGAPASGPLGAPARRRPAACASRAAPGPTPSRGGRAARLPRQARETRLPGRRGARAPPEVRPAECQAPLHTPAAAARRPQALHVLGSGPRRSDSPASSPPPARGAAQAASPALRRGPQDRQARQPRVGPGPGPLQRPGHPKEPPWPPPLTMMATASVPSEGLEDEAEAGFGHRARSCCWVCSCPLPGRTGQTERRHTGQRVRGGWRGRGAPAD